MTATLPTPIAYFNDLNGSKYSPEARQAVLEIIEGRDGRFHPYATRSEKAAAEKKIAEAKAAEEARILAEKKAAEEARIEAERIAQEAAAAAEAERQRQAVIAEAAEKARQQVQVPAPATAKSFGGSCASWIAAAGITDVANANELIDRESECNPYATNPSSGACGVAQELPCGKSGCSLGDGACQVRWMNSYVLGRYGSWAAAVGFHDRNNWY